MVSAYDRLTYHGRTLNRRTVAMIKQAEDYLGYELTLLQGSYNAGGVKASAGTHDGGGAVDLAPAHAEDKVRVLRQVGFAAWHRQDLPGVWNEHVHAIAIGDAQMSAGAAKQVSDYYAHLDGLASHAHDPAWRPTVIVKFHYPLPTVDLSNVVAQAKHPTKDLPGVRRVQRALNIKAGAKLKVDGLYGTATKNAMKRYERQHGGDGDGIPGTLTKRLGLALFNVKE